MKAAFLGPAYKSRSLPLACQTAVNLILEPAAQGSGEQGMFFVAPGLLHWLTVGTGPIRGMLTAAGYLWVVSGTSLYRVSAGQSVTSVGTVPGAGRVTLIANETQLVVMHEQGWRICTMASLAFTTVTDAPTTAQGTYIGGRIVFPQDDGTYGWTPLNNASALDALDFASAEYDTDAAVATYADHGELLVFGERSVEWYVESGDPELPYQRTAISEYGCAAKHSVVAVDNTVFWLGKDEKGDPRVYRANGRSPQGVSDYAIDLALAGYGDLSDAFAFAYQQEGHTYYMLTVPGRATWCYDLSTGAWHQRAYRDPDSGELQRHRSNAYAYFGSKHLVGDYESGKLYQLSMTTYEDDGAPLYWERTWPHIEAENVMIRFDRMEVIAEMGVGLDGGEVVTVIFDNGPFDPAIFDDAANGLPTPGARPYMNLTWSDDGGRSFPAARPIPMGALGEYRSRAMTTRLGMSRRRVFRLYGSEPVKTALYGVNIKAVPYTR